MRLPTIQGVIDRRIPLNYRVDPHLLAKWLPPPFRPLLVGKFAMAGICLIRLKHIRPRALPAWTGIGSENAAHRFAVQWEQEGRSCEGVFVQRRDTNSRLNHWAGGRVFPGLHHLACFQVEESPAQLAVSLRSHDGSVEMSVRARPAAQWPATSVFGSLDEASAFFEAGSVGYSPTPLPGRYQGLKLQCHRWSVEALQVETAHSTFFDDPALFPPGSIQLDCALLMRHVPHQWSVEPELIDQRSNVNVLIY